MLSPKPQNSTLASYGLITYFYRIAKYRHLATTACTLTRLCSAWRAAHTRSSVWRARPDVKSAPSCTHPVSLSVRAELFSHAIAKVAPWRPPRAIFRRPLPPATLPVLALGCGGHVPTSVRAKAVPGRRAHRCANGDFQRGGARRWVRVAQGEVTEWPGVGRIVPCGWCGVAHMRWRGLYDLRHKSIALTR